MKKPTIFLLIVAFFISSCTKIAQQPKDLLNQNNFQSAVKVVTNSAAPNGVLHFESKAEIISSL